MTKILSDRGRDTSGPRRYQPATTGDDGIARYAQELPPDTSVAAYFSARLGAPLDLPDNLGREMPISSPCGTSCRGAIDAAAAVLAHSSAAGGSKRALAIYGKMLRDITTETVRVYIYG